MKKLSLPLALALCVLGGIAVQADDTVRKVTGEQIKGSVKSVSKDGVVLEKGGKEDTLKPFEVDSIRFEDEPAKMISIRSQINNGGYENALKGMESVAPDSLERAETKAELQYLKAYCNARLALGGSVDVTEAGKQMLTFIRANPDSYHFYGANELLGDLLVAAGRYDNAATYYKALADSPFDEYKMQAAVAIGRARQAEKKFPEALKEFDTALALAEKGSGPTAENAKEAALIGKASCLAETGKPDDGIKLVGEVLAKLPAEEVDLHARAYVAQGNCYAKKPDSAKQALIAFLHVDVLYFSNSQAHAEALWNLSKLWNDIGKPERATQTIQLLKERYPNSPWAKL
jgi:tetratricopeptide (TPR) repeat protein